MTKKPAENSNHFLLLVLVPILAIMGCGGSMSLPVPDMIIAEDEPLKVAYYFRDLFGEDTASDIIVYDCDTGKSVTVAETENASGLVADANTGMIAYTDGNYTNSDIWIVKADGTGNKKVYDGDGINYFPVFSPDGSRIAFSSTDPLTQNDIRTI